MEPNAQLDLLTQGLETIHSKPELLKKLQENRPLRIKFGVDPTSPDIHLGHTVPLLKLRQFQDLGHTAVLIIGDFTARIGDPTGKNSTRPMLSAADIQSNARTYEEQAFHVLDRSKTEVVWNGSWFDTMTLMDTMRLLARKTVAQTLQRRDFKERMAAGHDIMMHELQYPILQGWDSVMVRADVELGGSDQLFNLLTGRDLQQQEKQTPQVVMTLPILEGTDGVEKMSKSLGNYIGVTEAPSAMFGKVMSVSDELMARWYPTLLGRSIDLEVHPMEAKKKLAAEIVERFHSHGLALEARVDFESKFSKKDLSLVELPEHCVSENPIWIVKLLQDIKAVSSGGDARRLVQQGGVKVNEIKITDVQTQLEIKSGDILQAGKKTFVRLQTSAS
ncbi:MAG: tyrosine--tRNA ligase [Blastochloris sp.]|nr:tyrosine--tRNA ligase [Blastochloris sp.]